VRYRTLITSVDGPNRLTPVAGHPARWSGPTRDWSLIDAVTLNPERDQVVKMAAGVQHTQLKAA